MTGKKPPIVYWDTNVFISAFDGGRHRSPEQIRAIQHWKDLSDAGAATIVTSALTYAEVLYLGMNADEYKDFSAFLRSRVEVKDADFGVMRMVRDLRLHNEALPRPSTKNTPAAEHRLCLPDAIHLATAIIFKCDELHTFDRRNHNKCTGLLKVQLPSNASVVVMEPAAPPLPPPPIPSLLDALDALDPITERPVPAEAGAPVGQVEPNPTPNPSVDLPK